MKPWPIAIGLLCLLVGLVIADCSAGRSISYERELTGRYHKDAWTETTTHWDGEHLQVDTVRHPEEWHLVMDDFDLSVSAGAYHRTTNGQWVVVSARRGRWSGCNYFASVE